MLSRYAALIASAEVEGQTSLATLWGWLCDVARSSEAAEPLAVHSQSGDRNGWGQANASAIRALPFSRTFLRRVDRELPRAVREALELLRADPSLPPMLRSARRAQFKVIAAVLRDGHVDQERCRAAVGLSSWAFAVAAESGIRALQSALGRD